MDICEKMKLAIGLISFLQIVTYIQGEYTFTYLGCFNDDYSPRALETEPDGFKWWQNTIEYCGTLCGQQGYRYAGLEYGYLCYCCNSTYDRHGSEGAICDHECSGNNNQTCGGWWSISVYEVVKVTTTTPATTTSTATVTTTATTTTTETTTISTTTETTTPTTTIPTTTVIPTTIMPTQSQTTIITPAITSPTQVKTTSTFSETLTEPKEGHKGDYTFTYLGCFKEEGSARALENAPEEHQRSQNTIEYCVTLCGQEGYRYAGLQYGQLCWCGNSGYDRYGSEGAICDYECSGNSSQICGGLWATSVYEVVDSTTITGATATSAISASATTPTTTTTTFTTTKISATTLPSEVINISDVSKTVLESKDTILTIENQSDGSKISGDKKPTYIGIGVGAVIVCAIIVLVVVLVVHRRKPSFKELGDNLPSHDAFYNNCYESNDLEITSTSQNRKTGNEQTSPAAAEESGYLIPTPRREDNIYINSTQASVTYYNCTTQASDNQLADNNCEDEQVYSLAEPLIDDLVVVDNLLYEV